MDVDHPLYPFPWEGRLLKTTLRRLLAFLALREGCRAEAAFPVCTPPFLPLPAASWQELGEPWVPARAGPRWWFRAEHKEALA